MTGWELLAVKRLLDRPIADLSLRQCWTLYLLSSLMYYSYDESLIRDNDFDNLCARLLTEMAVRPAEYTLYGLELYDPDALRAGSGYHVTPKTAPRAILQMVEFAHPTRRVAPMNQQPLPWSHSSLSTFTSCPKKFYHLKVVKDVVDSPPGEEALWGDYLHKTFEKALKTGNPLPIELAQYQPYIDKLVKLKGDGEAHVELKLGLNAQRGPTDFFADDVWSRGIIDYLVIRGNKAIVVDHKGLDVDTKIPTPGGFVRMGDLLVGDEVFDKDGKICRVTDKSQVKHIPCYRVTFNDGSSVVCDEEHLWYTNEGDVIGVHDLMGGMTKRQRTNVPKIPVCGAMRYPAQELPIHPYVLGMWIADGKNSSGEISKPDMWVWDKIVSLGYAVNRDSKQSKSCPTYTVKGIRKHLADLGLLGVKEKHIPEIYMQASIEQRLDLLQGLMDGDGSANVVRKQCVYCTTQEPLAQDVQRLLCSLGQQPYISPFAAHGFGKSTTAYYVSFRPHDITPFSAPAKADKVVGWGDGHSRFRRAVKVESVPIRPTQCIAVDSPSRTYLCTERMIVTHNTGKVKPSKQLLQNALMIFAHYTQVDTVDVVFYWLKFDSKTHETFRRDDIPQMWSQYDQELASYALAFRQDIWPARQSGLCRGWCPVETCPHWRPKK